MAEVDLHHFQKLASEHQGKKKTKILASLYLLLVVVSLTTATDEKHQDSEERTKMASSEIQPGCSDSRGMFVRLHYAL